MVPCENIVIRSSAASTEACPPAWRPSYQRLPSSKERIPGTPPARSLKKPIASEWSAITSQSSGRASLTG
jgi:hypothetical protein